MHARTREPLLPLAYSIPDTARISGLGETTIWKAISDNKLPAVKVGKRRVVLVADLEAFLDRHKEAGPGEVDLKELGLL